MLRAKEVPDVRDREKKMQHPWARLTLSALLIGTAILGSDFTVGHAASVRSSSAARFSVSVTGKATDKGAVSGPSQVTYHGADFNGCGIVKHKKDDPLGPYTFEIHLNRDKVFVIAGEKPTGQEVDLLIANYRPSVVTYRSPKVSGTFAINGHAYGASVVHSVAHLTRGGLSGTYTDSDASRLYPGSAPHLLKGLSFHATWSCPSLNHIDRSHIP
jgi:hypothetical protein